MAARRRFDHEDSGSDDSDCSVSSKWTAQSEPRDNYPVDGILAEKQDEDAQDTLFLVKWTGYSKGRCTWEPAGNFSSTTMDQWVQQKNAIKLGYKAPFQVEAWKRDQRKKAGIDRCRWRRRKAMLKSRQDYDWAEPPENHPAFQEDFDSDGDPPEALLLSPPRHMLPGAGRKTSAARSRSRMQASAKRNTQNNQEKRRGADIMANYASEPTTKRVRKPADEDQQYKTASHRWNVEKKSRDGAVPRAEDIEALLARPGEIQSLQHSNLTGIVNQTATFSTDTHRDAANEGTLAPYADTIPLTCFYWHNALTCSSGREQCRFTHGGCDRIADQYIHQQTLEEGTAGWKPKFWSPTRVCFYWNKGGCDKGDTGCWFAHWRPKKGPWIVYHRNNDKKWPDPIMGDIDIVPQPERVPPSGPRAQPSVYQRTRGTIKQQCHFWKTGHCRDRENCKWMHGYVQEPAMQTAQQQVPTPSPAVPSRKPLKTCPYWYYNKNCNKTAETCEFAHELLPEVQSFKSTRLKICPYWLNGNGCSKSADVCRFLHEFVEGLPIAEAPRRRIYQPANSTSNCDNYTTSAMEQHFLGDPLEPLLTPKCSMLPQAHPNQTAPAGSSILDNRLAAPCEHSGYPQHLAQESAERGDWKIQVTQTHTPQISPPTDVPDETSGNTVVDDSFPSLEDPNTDRSSEAMDLDSGIMESPDTLDTVYAPSTLKVSLQLSDAPMCIPVEIVDLEYDAIDALRRDHLQEPQIAVSQMVMRDLLETFVLPLAPNVLSSGKIFQMNGQDMSLQLSRTLANHSSVAISQGPSSLLILYPSHLILEERVFVERDKTPIEPNCHICVQVRALGSNFPKAASSATSAGLPKTLDRYFQKYHGLEPGKLFKWGSETVKKNVFIMSHAQSHKAETEILARYFRELGARVWTTRTKGSWDDFLRLSDSKSKGSGVIILHPDFVHYAGIPNLRQILLERFNIFQLRLSMKEGLPERLIMKRLLPNGTCTLLVDEMYIKHPQKSLELLELIVKKNDGREKKVRSWSVYGPPQLPTWLLNIYFAKEKEEEDLAKLQVRMALYDKAQLLEDDFDDASSGAPLLVSAIDLDAAEVPTNIPVDQTAYEAYRNEDPVGAARKLVETFVTTSLRWAEQYRRLVVIVPPRETLDADLKKVYDEWEASSRAQHISFWTPDTFIKTFRGK